MSQTSLRRFQEIVRAGSIRAAADRLHVTPSALSREIARLEEELGVLLLERQRRGVVLTSAGEIYLQHARDVLQGEERMRSELDALQGLRRGRVSLLSVEGYAPDFVAQAIVGFQRRHGDVSFTLRLADSSEVLAGLLSGEADIGFAFNADPADITVALTLAAPLLAIMAPSHRLARARRLSLAELAGERLALPDTSFGVRRLIDTQAQIAHLRLNPALEANSLAVLRGFARHGGGVTLLSRMSVQAELKRRQLTGVPLSDRLLNEGRIDVCVLAGRRLPIAAATFLDHVARVGHELAPPGGRPERAAPRPAAPGGVAPRATPRSK